MQEAGPTKYLVGTEHGVVLSCNKKPKKAVEAVAATLCIHWMGSYLKEVNNHPTIVFNLRPIPQHPHPYIHNSIPPTPHPNP
jgi:hypothetical protein